MAIAAQKNSENAIFSYKTIGCLTNLTPNIQVLPVKNRRQLAAFIRLPWRIYADDPHWIPPLRLERRLHFSAFNPYFAHSRWQAWVAWRGGEPVGRVTAQVDELHRQRHGAQSGHFGFLECGNNPEVARALTMASEEWLTRQRAEVATGPFNFSINQECGMLVAGFETPPAVMMPHNRPWHGALLEQQGYAPVKDLLAYWLNMDYKTPRAMQALVDRHGRRIVVRPMRRKNFKEELERLRDIFNDAWSDNWGFVPFTQAEFAELGMMLRAFVPDDFVQIAEWEGTPAAFIVGLPNLNEVLKDLNGRLFPLGAFRLLKALKTRRFATGRVPLMGVRKPFQQSVTGMALIALVIDALRQSFSAAGIQGLELSWILEDNRGLRNILDKLGARVHKTYRLYEKRL